MRSIFLTALCLVLTAARPLEQVSDSEAAELDEGILESSMNYLIQRAARVKLTTIGLDFSEGHVLFELPCQGCFGLKPADVSLVCPRIRQAEIHTGSRHPSRNHLKLKSFTEWYCVP